MGELQSPQDGIRPGLRIELHGADVRITWSASAGTLCDVMASSDGRIWTSIRPGITAVEGENHVTEFGGAGAAQRFYKVIPAR